MYSAAINILISLNSYPFGFTHWDAGNIFYNKFLDNPLKLFFPLIPSRAALALLHEKREILKNEFFTADIIRFGSVAEWRQRSQRVGACCGHLTLGKLSESDPNGSIPCHLDFIALMRTIIRPISDA